MCAHYIILIINFRTADSRLNNFTRLEPTLKLLEVPYDTNVVSSFIILLLGSK